MNDRGTLARFPNSNTAPAQRQPAQTWIWVAATAASVVTLGRALFIRNGALHPDALFWLTLSILAIAVALWGERYRYREEAGRLWLPAILASAVVFQFLEQLTTMPGIYLRVSPEDLRPFIIGTYWAAGLACAAMLAPPGRLRNAAMVGLLICHFCLGLWLISASPSPLIDVHVFQRDAAEALLAGRNPYELRYPNIYGDGAPVYGPGLSVGGRLQFGFVYPPLSLLLVLPGHVLGGDYRYAHLAAYTLTGALMAFGRPGPFSAAATALYLFFPRNLFVIEQGWTEPLQMGLVALTTFLALRAPRLLPLALGLLLASKQYMFLSLPLALLLLPRPWRWAAAGRLVGQAVLVALAVTVPMAVWNLREFVHSTLLLQFLQPYRPDALSYLSWLHGPDGAPGGAEVAACFVLALGGVALSLWKAARTPAGYAFGTAVVFMGFLVFNKQSSLNHYFLPLGSLCLSLALSGYGEERPPASVSGPIDIPPAA